MAVNNRDFDHCNSIKYLLNGKSMDWDKEIISISLWNQCRNKLDKQKW